MPFSCDIVTDPEIRAKIKNASRVASLALPLECLPNIHRKVGLESPPQFVASTRGTIVPMLSAPSMNCGMSVFKTSLKREDFTPERFAAFAESLRASVPPRRSRIASFLSWLGFKKQHSTEYDLTVPELEACFRDGASAAVKKYGLRESELDHIEYHGCLFTEEEKRRLNFKSLIPRSSYTNARHEMGYNFGGNHFLEFHEVIEIKDPKSAERLGIHEGMILLYYHGGGGHATYHLGRYYGNREKNTAGTRFALFFLKIFFHFFSAEGIARARERWTYYMSRKPFPEIPLGSPEGRRLMQSIKCAMNYGYAFRVALLARITNAMQSAYPESPPEISFLYDGSHNSIIEEDTPEGRLVVHRQDAMRIFPETPVMIAGLPNTYSFIGIGTSHETPPRSVSPSAAKTIEEKERAFPSAPDSTNITLRSKRKYTGLERIPHKNSDGLFEIVRAFEEAGMIHSVAYLRPLGTIKGH